MADDSRDVLMKLEMTAGKYLPAECVAVIDTKDPMAKDFTGTKATGNLIRGNYFQIDDFSFDIGIAERGAADQMDMQAADVAGQFEAVSKQVNTSLDLLNARMKVLNDYIRRTTGGAPEDGGGAPKVKPEGGRSAAFERFMSEGRNFLRRERNAYPSDLEPVSVTKRMDISSTTLLDCCRQSFKFKSASILKRRAVGKELLNGFLRIDFTDVMLISLDWDDDEVTKESFKFVSRKAEVFYSMETASTSTSARGAAVLTQQPSVVWSVLPTR